MAWIFIFSYTWILSSTLTHGLLLDQDSLNGGCDPGKKVAPEIILCNGTKALDVCLEKMSLIKEHGIPSNHQALEEVCTVFLSGMQCMDNWTSTCLSKQERETVKNSVIGTLETYNLLCSDPSFRRNFLRHASCYKRLSYHWDECARQFTQKLRMVQHTKMDLLSLCCTRFTYLNCVSVVAKHFCPTSNATQFIKQLAESFVRSTMYSYDNSVTVRNCNGVSSSSCQSSIKAIVHYSFPFQLLSSPHMNGITYFLEILQNSNAFSDISTLFGALFRELGTYFGYFQQPYQPEEADNNVLPEDLKRN